MEKTSTKKKKVLNVLLTHKGLEPYSIKIDSQNITVIKNNASIGYYSNFGAALDKIAKLKTLELTKEKFGEQFPMENYVKSLYKIKNVFNNQVVKSLDEQLKNIRNES